MRYAKNYIIVPILAKDDQSVASFRTYVQDDVTKDVTKGETLCYKNASWPVWVVLGLCPLTCSGSCLSFALTSPAEAGRIAQIFEPKLLFGQRSKLVTMDQNEVFEKVKEIIVEQLGVDEADVKMGASFREDLEADSLDLVELIMAFEEAFGGEISDEEAQKITTVGEAVTYLTENS